MPDLRPGDPEVEDDGAGVRDLSRTLTRDQVSDLGLRLAAALYPWPISNERAWAVIEEHLDELRRELKGGAK